MKNKKKIKLEDLKIQSFSTSHLLSREDTDKIIGGTPTTVTEGCGYTQAQGFCNTANGSCTCPVNCTDIYGGCGGGGPSIGCVYPTDLSDCCGTAYCGVTAFCTGVYC